MTLPSTSSQSPAPRSSHERLPYFAAKSGGQRLFVEQYMVELSDAGVKMRAVQQGAEIYS